MTGQDLSVKQAMFRKIDTVEIPKHAESPSDVPDARLGEMGTSDQPQSLPACGGVAKDNSRLKTDCEAISAQILTCRDAQEKAEG